MWNGGNITKNTGGQQALASSVKSKSQSAHASTIEPGTVVCGDATDPQRASANTVMPAFLQTEPRTSRLSLPAAAKKESAEPSDWGGVRLRGRAAINLPPGNEQACGSSGRAGLGTV